jgi:protein-S-isoprenylcysteine O-methyltransferase Ste14
MAEAEVPVVRPIKLSSFGWSKLWHDLRHKRYRHRQFVGIVALLFVVAFAEPWRTPRLFWPGAVAALLGVLIRLWASGHVKKDKVLATTGPYALVRHPLYLGNHLIMLGFCLASGLWWSWLVWLAVAVLYYPPAVTNEDGRLHNLFGADWEAWRAVTPAILPNPARLGRVTFGGRWSFAQSLRANGEPVIALVMIGLLALVHARLV